VETLFQRLYVANLMPNREAPGNPVRFVSESTVTNAAAAVAETGTKPESTLAFGETSEPVRKIATMLPVSDELLEDAPQIGAYLNARLTLFVQTQEEQQLLLGSGTAPNLQGFVASGRPIGTYARGTVDDNALALFKAANGTRGSSQLDPDTIVINPTNWQAIRTAKDNQGQYYGGGPFYGPYGGPQGPAGPSQFSADSLWGLRVVVTSSMTVGSALVGAFAQGAGIYRKGGVRVEATNSHGSYCARNITAIRAEQRLALAVYRPSAFVCVTGAQLNRALLQARGAPGAGGGAPIGSRRPWFHSGPGGVAGCDFLPAAPPQLER
jgi:HK97 family phage major capsid protein